MQHRHYTEFCQKADMELIDQKDYENLLNCLKSYDCPDKADIWKNTKNNVYWMKKESAEISM